MKNNRTAILEMKKLQNSDFKCSLFLLQRKFVKSVPARVIKKG